MVVCSCNCTTSIQHTLSTKLCLGHVHFHYFLIHSFFETWLIFPLQVQNTGKRKVMCWVCWKETAFIVGHIVRKRSWPVPRSILTFFEGRKKSHGYLMISEIPSDIPTRNLQNKSKSLPLHQSGFGGLVVNMLTSGTRVRGFEPGRSHWIFQVSE